MKIQCDCGKFIAKVEKFPKETPGRAVCYCDDCQLFMKSIGRIDLLDANGGTEIVPVYSSNIHILTGKENLECIRLKKGGTYRWKTNCCNTPIGNTAPRNAWFGMIAKVFNQNDSAALKNLLGPVKSRIHGRFAIGTPPKGTSEKIGFKDFLVVFPFILKGKLLKSRKKSEFFDSHFKAIVKPKILFES